MKDHGLYLVFLGIEDGTDTGLSRFNKQMTVQKSLAGINILKELDIGFDYGFMLFQPWSTFDTIRDNLNFLIEICKDGFTPVSWLKMLPFFETRIERELKNEGRITGEPGFLDYNFLNPSLDKYFEYTSYCFSEWLLQTEGLLNLIKWARNYFSVFNFYYRSTPDTMHIKNEIRQICFRSNLFILDKMIELLIIFEEGGYDKENYSDLESFKTEIKIQHDQYKQQITKKITVIMNNAALQELSKSIYK